MVVNIIVVVTAILLFGILAFWKRLSNSADFQATLTPLASIMGSGFLVSAPLLGGLVGSWAVVMMAILLLIAYLIGEAIRFNIKHFEPIENKGNGKAQHVAFVSRLALILAYFVSVTYYLQLLAAFALSSLGVNQDWLAPLITSILLGTIGLVGARWGLDMLVALEKYAVALNLGVVGALLLSLVVYNLGLLGSGAWQLPDVDSTIDLSDVRVLMGLLIVVQGFETSRYLGDKYDADRRIRTCRMAQWVSGVIYVVFISLATVLFDREMGSDVTAIIRIVTPVAIVLPIMISVAAIGSQFSAAVADNAGAAGLLTDLAKHRMAMKYAYYIILAVALFLAWATDVNGIIAYASRAFALYYALQCRVAYLVAAETADLPHRTWKRGMFAFAGLFALAVVIFGLPSGA
ncbi:hypothetical protein SV7mr_28750 [Stieleria bergensis]|uniref:Uncharacterized protein n=1 Tax=Stieleria bergensis TaxID=2528025 RepID=A0A517SW43_9BACT|nr:hypothetical protein SV7mr_28750 [Planctomycetes bacterium SV_7m_r]